MVLRVRDFAKLSAGEISDLFSPAERCLCGGIASKEYAIAGKPACPDCHYMVLDKLISAHPIGLPRYYQKENNIH